MANQEKIAYIVGMAIAVGFKLGLRRRGLSFDANTNNPYWITTENGHHFLIDEEGTIQSGRFKNQSISGLKDYWDDTEFKRRNITESKIRSALKTVLSQTSGQSKKELKRSSAKLTASQYYGREVAKVESEDPVATLLTAKSGHIKDAYQRPDIPGMEHIDLVWGTSSAGLMHIIRERYLQHKSIKDIDQVLKSLSETIRYGKLMPHKNDTRRLKLKLGKSTVILGIGLNDDESRRYVITSFYPN